MLKLYTGRGTIGLACEIALEEAGAPYEAHRLSFADNEQRGDAYLAVNPKSRVPSLEDGPRRDHRDARDPGLHRPDLPCRRPRAGRLCLRDG